MKPEVIKRLRTGDGHAFLRTLAALLGARWLCIPFKLLMAAFAVSSLKVVSAALSSVADSQSTSRISSASYTSWFSVIADRFPFRMVPAPGST